MLGLSVSSDAAEPAVKQKADGENKVSPGQVLIPAPPLTAEKASAEAKAAAEKEIAERIKKLKAPYTDRPLKVRFETTLGNFVIKTTPSTAPLTVSNFIQYVKAGFYDETVFHRVLPGFVVQGGGYTTDMTKKPTGEPIVNESAKAGANATGTLSMARTSQPDSATSQFFINLKDNVDLDHRPHRAGYAVFAKVVEGMDVVRKIEREPRGMVPGYREAPNSLPHIIKAVVVDETIQSPGQVMEKMEKESEQSTR